MQIFVRNLALSTTEDELRQLFAPYGSVERVEIVKDRYTGYSRGFGFVDMPDATQARAVMLGLEGARLGGRALHLEAARPREERRPRGDGPRRPREARRPQGDEPRGPRW